eukprot:TRINITY_DN10840_c0_g1_i2.p1 TRINITY_DN10840_c0_g1~~TRINITY_DN10840_c0_g1_i2.p1  ORF type:complete len:806 (-),score=215.76 TRINITY_DN10840_c0_g1_i2:27-2444(-)
MVLVSEIVRGLVNDTSSRLGQEVMSSGDQQNRKTRLLAYVQHTRHQLLRLRVLVKWCRESSGLIARTGGLHTVLEERDSNIVGTADGLFELYHMCCRNLVRVPQFQVRAAAEILSQGDPQLPAVISKIGAPPVKTLTDEETRVALQSLDRVICGRLLRSEDATKFTSLEIGAGQVCCTVDREFKVWLTLEGSDTPWRLLDLKILVESVEGREVGQEQVFEMIHCLQQGLIQMKHDQQPLNQLCDLARDFCVKLQMDILHSQAERFGHGEWSRTVTEDHQALTLKYWSEVDSGDDQVQGCSIKISLDLSVSDRSDRLLLTTEPVLPGAASLELNQHLWDGAKLDLKGLLQWVTHKQMDARLQQLHSWLKSGMDASTSEQLLRLEPHQDAGLLQLQIQLSEFQCFEVHVDLWSGKFVLQSANMSTQVLDELQSILNGPMLSTPDFFSNLRRRSHSIEMFGAAQMRGMVAYLQGMPFTPALAVCVPGAPPAHMSDHTVYVRFPQCPNTFATVQFDEQLQPSFALLSSGKVQNVQLTQPARSDLAPKSSDAPNPARKRKRLANAEESKPAGLNADKLIRSQYSELLSAMITANQSAAQTMELVQMMSSAGIPFKRRPDCPGTLEFFIDAEPFDISKAATRTLTGGGFDVVLAQQRPVLAAVQCKTNSSGHGLFSYTQETLTFSYEQDQTWAQFLSDLQAVRMLTRVCMEVETMAASNSLPCFQVQELSPAQIRLSYQHEGTAHTLQFRFAHSAHSPCITMSHTPACSEVDAHLNLMLKGSTRAVSYTHLRAHETVLDLVCRLLLEKKKK